MDEQINMPFTIYAENTPNPQSMKFVANKLLINQKAVEFLNSGAASSSPLALKLFQFPFVTSVFISGNYVTVNKIEALDWQDVVMDLRIMLTEFLNSGNIVIQEDIEFSDSESPSSKKTKNQKPKLNELDLKISGVLNEFVRPAVEQDGGAIDFHSFNKGIVTVNLRGACSGCPSSSLTLKSGIETILKRLVPEVNEVIAVEL